MKRRLSLLLASAALLLCSMVLFHSYNRYTATPTPVPSAPGGYYPQPFTLTLDAPSQGTVYYTTDGSTPTTESQRYTGGIPLENRSSQPNVCNAVQQIVTDWKTFTPNPAPVDKGTVIRAIYVSPQGHISPVLTQTYFIGLTPPENGYTLSLVFDQKDLFGSDGIYVTGEDYDRWYLSGSADPAPTPNFRQDLEICATLQVLNGQQEVLNQAVGVQMQGNSARYLQRKRFVFTAREEYGGSQVFDAPLLNGVRSHSVMTKDVPMDAMLWHLVDDRAVSAQRSVPVRLYLNGEYWQDTYLLERYDNQYFRQNYNVPNPIVVKDNVPKPDTLPASEVGTYEEFMFWADHTDFSQPENYAQLLEEVDLQSYIDYISINYYLCNYDFSQWHNCILWRSPAKIDTGYRDRRWRWCLYDVDAGYYAAFTDYPGPPSEINVFNQPFPQTDIILNQNTLFLALKQNPDSRRQFVLSFMDIGNCNFAPERIAPVLAQYGLDLNWNSGFFRDRPAQAAQHLAQEFGLTGTLETVTIATSDASLGTVQVNTSVVDLSDGSWSGQYFTDYPITVTASPAPGAKFVGWQGDVESDQNTITVPMDGGVHLEAVFAPV